MEICKTRLTICSRMQSEDKWKRFIVVYPQNHLLVFP